LAGFQVGFIGRFWVITEGMVRISAEHKVGPAGPLFLMDIHAELSLRTVDFAGPN
jgi:hypothetical protein